MTDPRFFLDSNVVLYAFGDDERQSTIAQHWLKRGPISSVQVFNECSAVMCRKLRLSPVEVMRLLTPLTELVHLTPTGIDVVQDAWRIGEQYGYSHYDCLIIATALAAGCSTLYSEDLQHSQVIDRRLTIIDPFRAVTEVIDL